MYVYVIFNSAIGRILAICDTQETVEKYLSNYYSTAPDSIVIEHWNVENMSDALALIAE